MSLVRFAGLARRSVAAPSVRGVAIRGISDIPDNKEHATGREKIELEALEKGEKVFDRDPIMAKPGQGTRENPILVPSIFESRVVGVSYAESSYVDYFNLEKGPLFHVKKFDKYFKLYDPTNGEGAAHHHH